MLHDRVAPVFAACCLVAAALAFVGADRLASTGHAARLADRERATVAAADAFATVLATARSELDAVAEELGPWSGTPAEEGAARSLLSGPLPLAVLDGVTVVGADRIVRSADPSSTSSIGRQTDAAVLPALAGTEVVTGPTVGADGRGEVRVAVPLEDEQGRPSGVLVGTLRGDGALGRTAAAVAGDGGAAPHLVWSDGTVLGVDGRFDRDVALRAPAQLAADGPGSRLLPSAAGQELVSAYAPLPSGWAVVATEPAGAFAAPTRRPVVLTLVALGLVAVGTVSTLLWARRRVASAQAEADAARRSLLAVAGHELRTPLTVVSGGLQTLESRWDDLPDERRREVLVFTRRHARRLEHQVERLLFAAQLDRGPTAGAAPRDVDLAALVRDAVDEQAVRAPAHRFTVVADTEATVHADLRALEQVLFHLLENAVRYSPGGGEVTVRVVPVGTAVELVVEDDGVGLPADTSRLFERFGQVEAVDTRVLAEGGLGLGLHIVRTLVERQSGTVHADNRPGGGAAFTVTLPRVPTPAPSSPASPRLLERVGTVGEVGR